MNRIVCVSSGRISLLAAVFLFLFTVSGVHGEPRLSVSPEQIELITVEDIQLACVFVEESVIVTIPLADNAQLPYQSLIKKEKKKQKKAKKKGNRRKVKKLRRRLRFYKAVAKEAQNRCFSRMAERDMLPEPTPSPTPGATPTPSPTPTPTPTPTPERNFRADGTVTSKGHEAFQIPSEWTANVSVGQGIYNSNCAGCHSEKLGRSFPNYRTSIAKPPMFYDKQQISDAELAHLTAYLNRFNQ